jgi:hypothetical protein
MSQTTAAQRTIQWIKAQCTELEIKIAQLTNELDQARREYNGFTALLSKIQDENSGSWDTQENYSGSPPPDDSEMEELDSSNSEDEKINETPSEQVDKNIDDEDEIDDYEESAEDNSSPKDWLYPEYKDYPMEDLILEILKQCQPAKPSDIALRIYQIAENDPNFERARNSANAALTNGKKAGKWKTLKRGVYVLNSFPKSFAASVNQNGYN